MAQASRVLVAAHAAGRLLKLDEPLSLWGGVDPETGTIVDRRHPQHGAKLAGRVLVLPSGRGSSSASSILLEAVRLGTAPVAIVTREVDGILALGAAVAREIYRRHPAVLVVDDSVYSDLEDGEEVEITLQGSIRRAREEGPGLSPTDPTG